MSEWINSKGLDAIIALLKDFMVALLAKHGSQLGNLTLVSLYKRPSLASLPIRSWTTWPSRACHLTDSELELKYETKAVDVLLSVLLKSKTMKFPFNVAWPNKLPLKNKSKPLV